MIYLYAITEADAGPPPCIGLEDAEVRLAKGPEVSAIYSAHERIEPRLQPEALWRHEQVVEAAMQAAPTLPVRFGTTLEDQEALAASLEREGPRLRRQLERVRGCVELAVRVGAVDGGPAEATAKDGREYLEAKLKERRQERAIVSDTLSPLSTLAVGALYQESRADDELVCASYLVQSDQVGRFSEEVTLVAERNPELWLSCTGPWPPYSFAGSESPT